MKLIEKKDYQLVFTAEIEDSLANAIRRYLNHIPIVAVDEVEIFKNDSPLYDETVSHRIGLIPLKMERGIKNEPKIKISANKAGFVHSKEIKGEISPVYDKIPITYLNEGQELELTATTKSGTGIEHSKFSPGLMFYRNVAEITVDKSVYNEIKNSIGDNEAKERGNKVVILDDGKNEIADVCESISERHGKEIEVNLRDDLIINLESFGQISCEEMFKKSIDEFRKDIAKLAKNL